jgi:hypothetical protein
MKVRGSSSATFDKKQYTLKFLNENGKKKKKAILGMPEDSDWILYTTWILDRYAVLPAFLRIPFLFLAY